MQDTLSLVGSILLALAAVIATASVVVHAQVRWWASQMGRHLMAYMAVIAAVLDLGLIRFLFSGTGVFWFEVLRLVVFAGVPVVLGQRLYLQLKARRSGVAVPTRYVGPNGPDDTAQAR